jgi:molybdenum cofactor biosynthesis enzyme MoaA
MSVETTLAAVGTDLKSFWTKLKADIATAKAIWNIIDSPQTRAVVITVAQQAIQTVKDAVTAAESEGINLTLDAVVVKDIQTLIADAKTDGVIASDLKAIGILL